MSAQSAPVAAPKEAAREEIGQVRQEELEPKGTDGTKTEEEETLAPALSHEEREDGAELPAQSGTPSPGSPTNAARRRAEPPSSEGKGIRRVEHPGGEAFFRRDANELTDEEAERIAREQLSRAGLLRGQRVRVGD